MAIGTVPHHLGMKPSLEHVANAANLRFLRERRPTVERYRYWKMKLALLEVRQGKIATVRGSIRIDKGDLVLFAGLPPVKCPSLYPVCSHSFPPCMMSKPLPCLFSQSSPLYNVQAPALFVSTVFPPV